MAHSYVEAFPTERDAFATFAGLFPDRATFLVDTYDTLGGVRAAADVIRELGLVDDVGIRLDSGDIAGLARAARALLDGAGLPHVRIFASGGLDEHSIAELVRSGVPIDAVGVGSQLGVSADAPTVETAYKLVSYEGRPVRKRSAGKASIPGAKQVWRSAAGGDDLITARDEVVVGAEPLLVPVVRDGARVVDRPTIEAGRQAFRRDLDALPVAARRLRSPVPLAAEHSPALLRLAEEADAAHADAAGHD